MPLQFKYKAVGPDGARRSGRMAADSAASVEEYLHGRQLVPIAVKPVKAGVPFSLFGFLKGSHYENLIMFTNALATMHRAGIPLLRALTVIRIGDKEGRFNQALDRVRLDLQSGRPMSEAMKEFPDLFSDVYLASLAAGEESGRLDDTLEQLADMLEREAELTRQLKAGLQRPLMVIAAIVGAVFVLMNLVVPRFAAFYGAFGASLPLPTRILIAVSNFITAWWPLLLVGTVALGLVVRALLQNETGRRWFDNRLLALPVFGDLIIKGNIARFSLMFRILLSSGLTIVNSVSILTATVRNTVLAAEVRALGDLFRRGREINVESAHLPHFPAQALHMMAVGFESGNLDAILREVGEYYTRQVVHTSRQLTAIVEPVLTLVMAGFVLLLALAVFLPMWNLIRVFHP